MHCDSTYAECGDCLVIVEWLWQNMSSWKEATQHTGVATAKSLFEVDLDLPKHWNDEKRALPQVKKEPIYW